MRLLIHVTSAPCVTATEKVLRLARRIRVMRLTGGIPVPRINLKAWVNHVNRSDSLGRLQATVTLGAMLTPVTMTSPATGYPAGSRCLFMIAKDLVLLEVPDPSGSSKFCANMRPSRIARIHPGRCGRRHEPPVAGGANLTEGGVRERNARGVRGRAGGWSGPTWGGGCAQCADGWRGELRALDGRAGLSS
jgi:hypothetical protein